MTFRSFLAMFRFPFTPKAPPNPPGDFSSENAELIAMVDKYCSDKIGLWKSETNEAQAAGNYLRGTESVEILLTWAKLRTLEKQFYGRWKLRE